MLPDCDLCIGAVHRDVRRKTAQSVSGRCPDGRQHAEGVAGFVAWSLLNWTQAMAIRCVSLGHVGGSHAVEQRRDHLEAVSPLHVAAYIVNGLVVAPLMQRRWLARQRRPRDDNSGSSESPNVYAQNWEEL